LTKNGDFLRKFIDLCNSEMLNRKFLLAKNFAKSAVYKFISREIKIYLT